MMKRLTLALLALCTLAAAGGAAEAQRWHRGYYRHGYHHGGGYRHHWRRHGYWYYRHGHRYHGWR